MRRRGRLDTTGSRTQAEACPPEPPPRVLGAVRTCVGCRGRDLRSDLLRLVLAPSGDRAGDQPRVVADVRGCLPGRGAWLHRDLACLDLAVRRRAVPRALRAAGPLDLAEVRAYLEQQDR
ncbi:YlxR family protein [Isoptericola aurantiacus]|uniref:YlxR family protein n=1 Tax=Isoptericola aurantiacus TaxID=3377839 RepID=UPI00383B9BC4